MEMLISLPSYTDSLVSELEKHGLIIHCLQLGQDKSVYFPGNYIYDQKTLGLEHELIIDTNVFHFLLRSTEGIHNQKTRSAVGLVAFCQLASIDIEPALACYELINNGTQDADEAVSKLLRFDRINNSDTDELAKFCLGDANTYRLPNIPPRDSAEIKGELTKYRRLKEWDSAYLLVLAIVHFDQSEIHRDDKFVEFVKWMHFKFHESIPAGAFCAIYFGRSPLRGMMKYRSNDSAEQKRRSLINMTWDIFIILQFFRKWIGNTSKRNYLYASDDNAFKAILQLGIDVQIAKDTSPMERHLKPNVYRRVKDTYSAKPSDSDRDYYKAVHPDKYRDSLIEQFESLLGVTPS